MKTIMWSITLLLALSAASLALPASTVEKTNACGVAYAEFNNLLFQAWTGVCVPNKTPGQLFIASAPSGTMDFGAATAIQEETSELPPSLAVFNNRLFIAWTGTDSQLNVMSSPDGVTWNENTHQRLGQFAQWGPSLAVFNNKLFMAFTNSSSNDTNSCVALMSSTNGVAFTVPAFLPPFSKSEFPPETFEETIRAPALTVFKSKLFVAWSNIPLKLNFASSNDGTTFGNRVEAASPNPSVKVAASATATDLVIAFQEEQHNMVAVLKSTTGDSVQSITEASGTDLDSDDPALFPPLFSKPFLAWIETANFSGPITFEPLP